MHRKQSFVIVSGQIYMDDSDSSARNCLCALTPTHTIIIDTLHILTHTHTLVLSLPDQYKPV